MTGNGFVFVAIHRQDYTFILDKNKDENNEREIAEECKHSGL